MKGADLERLLAQGIDRAQVYEIMALVGLKTLSNWINHIAHTESDEPLAASVRQGARVG